MCMCVYVSVREYVRTYKHTYKHINISTRLLRTARICIVVAVWFAMHV